MKRDLVIRVKEIKGNCPLFKVGDSFYINNGHILVSKDPLCMHSLACILPYYVALSRGVPPEGLRIGKDSKAYLQCLDPCEYTGGGTVIFEVVVKEE